MLICTSTAIGVALVSNDMVDLILGSKWMDVKPLMPWLALAYGINGLASSIYSVFDTIGKPDISARLQWIRVAGLCVCLIPAALVFRNLDAMAISRFALTLLMTPTLFVVLSREFHLNLRDYYLVLTRPLAASVTMIVVILALQTVVVPGTIRLLITVVAGALTYSGTLMSLWYLSGRPDGPEKVLWWLLQTSRRRLFEVAAVEDELASDEGRIHTTSDPQSLSKRE